jgi:hypothetical protein
MKILIGTQHLKLNGIGTYVDSLTTELERRSHNVEITTHHIGQIGIKLRKNIVNIKSTIQKKYDLIIVFSNTNCREIISNEVEGYLVFMLQGLYFNNDIPRQEYLKRIDKVFSLTESSRNAIAKPGAYDFKGKFEINNSVNSLVRYNSFTFFNNASYSIESEVVHNPIDTSRYYIKNVLRDVPKVLILCKNKNAATIVKNSCDELEYESEWQPSPTYESTSVDKRFCLDMEEKINKFDIVVGIGRPVLEAMSCGRNVIVFDKRFYYKVYPADGFIDMDNIDDSSRFNFCGKDKLSDYSEKNMIEELKKYDKSLMDKFRMFILDNHSIEASVNKILKAFV